jgi:hypothetical protein
VAADERDLALQVRLLVGGRHSGVSDDGSAVAPILRFPEQRLDVREAVEVSAARPGLEAPDAPRVGPFATKSARAHGAIETIGARQRHPCVT